MDNNIDNIFSDEFENKIKKDLKIKRKKSNRKVIILATLCTLIVFLLCNVGLHFASNKYVYNEFNKDLNTKVMEYQIKHPNEYISNQKYIETGYFKFQTTLTISKIIGNKHFLADSLDLPGGLNKINSLGNSWFISMPFAKLSDDISERPNTDYSLRELLFMYPYVDYDRCINDFYLLPQIDDSKTVELSLSFDDEYNYDEINNLINSNLIKFYWVDTTNSEDNKTFNIEKQAYTGEDSAIGIKSTSYEGRTITDTEERLDKFKDSINYFNENNSPEIDSDSIDLNNIKISGVVVTGSPTELSQLKDIKIIKHCILGNVSDKF